MTRRSNKTLSVQWSKHLATEKERKDFEALVRNSTLVLTRVKQIIQEELDAQNKQEATISDFEDPNWANKQAFRNGSKSTLYKLKDLFNFT